METILSIVIVSFNAARVLEKCLLSLEDGCLGLGGAWEVVLVDNASEENVRKKITGFKNSHGGIKITEVFNKENLGFSRAVNQGIKKSRGQYILLLNPDVVCQQGSITSLYNFASERKDLVLVGGGLLDSDGQPQASVFHLPSIKGAFGEFWFGQRGAFSKYLPDFIGPVEVEAVVGAVMLIPREVIEKVGFLDERYFMYFEDLDYCRRVKNVGFKVFYFPEAKFTHFHGQSGKNVSTKVNLYLGKSSKIYNGVLRHYLINGVIWSGQKWRLLMGRGEG